MTKLNRDYLIVAAVLLAILVLSIAFAMGGRDTLTEQVAIAARDLGCEPIEQSYKNPENFYIDCGDDEIRIIKVEK